MIIETERLILEEMFKIHKNPATNIYNLSGLQETIEKAKEMLEEWMSHWSKHGFGYYVRKEIKSNNAIGMSGLTYKTISERTFYNVAYRLNPVYIRKGCTKEAVSTCVEDLKNRVESNLITFIRNCLTCTSFHNVQ